jgi:hypothetical protein
LIFLRATALEFLFPKLKEPVTSKIRPIEIAQEV